GASRPGGDDAVRFPSRRRSGNDDHGWGPGVSARSMSVEERKFVWANFARSTLAEGVSADATELRIRALDASLFPSPDYDEVFSVVLWSEDLESFEVVYCTGRVGDLLTVERGKEGTTPRAFAAGALVVHQATAGFFEQVTANPIPQIASLSPSAVLEGGGPFTLTI